jgi:DNA primase
MVLHELGYDSVAVQSEGSIPSKHVTEHLQNRFSDILVLFDNDSAGIQGAEKFCQLHDLQSIMIPKESKAKDIAEFVKLHGVNKAKHLVKCLIETELQVTIGKEK